jgi:hypothetical protein
MKTSLTNTRHIEQYLEGTMTPTNRLLFEARMILNPALRADVFYQKKALVLLKMYHRQLMKEEMERLHQMIFSKPENRDFKTRILQIFKENK